MWTHKKIKELEDTDFFDLYYDLLYFDSWDYENENEFDYDQIYDVNYKIDKDGLVDWSDEIPVSIKRQHKIDQILNGTEDYSNNIGSFWP